MFVAPLAKSEEGRNKVSLKVVPESAFNWPVRSFIALCDITKGWFSASIFLKVIHMQKKQRPNFGHCWFVHKQTHKLTLQMFGNVGKVNSRKSLEGTFVFFGTSSSLAEHVHTVELVEIVY